MASWLTTTSIELRTAGFPLATGDRLDYRGMTRRRRRPAIIIRNAPHRQTEVAHVEREAHTLDRLDGDGRDAGAGHRASGRARRARRRLAISARPGDGRAAGARVPVSAGWLDRSAHRGRALRSRLPARQAHGARNRPVHPRARAVPQHPGAGRRLARPAAPGRRPVPPPVRPRIPGGDEGDRRRRRGGRGQVRRPAGRPPRRRDDQRRYRDDFLETRSRPRRPAWKAGGSANPRRRADPPQASRTAAPSPRPGRPRPTARS